MDLLHQICAGLDVHKNTVVACVRSVRDGKVVRETRTFGTTTKALLELSQFLSERGCTQVAMEATGVYWKPVWHILEGSFELVLGNAQHIRNVPGRKSDVSDAAWLADLLAHGLIRPSFVPDRPTQELRDLTRTRTQMMRERAQHVNRLHKVLEDANIKLGSVISDITGVSGKAVLDALIAGEVDPYKLAALTSDRLKTPVNELVEALRGKVSDHHRFLLKTHLALIATVDATIESIDERIETLSRPFAELVERLDGIPGMSRTAAHTVLGEIGSRMDRFPTAGHLVSFAGLCPRMDESAGKVRSRRLRKTGKWLKATLVSCAWAAARSKNTYARAQFHRIKTRRGPKKAIIAVAASMLTAIYHMLRNSTKYADLGSSHFDGQDKARTARRLTARLEALGYSVTIAAAA